MAVHGPCDRCGGYDHINPIRLTYKRVYLAFQVSEFDPNSEKIYQVCTKCRETLVDRYNKKEGLVTMGKYHSKTRIEAIQIKGDNIKDVGGVRLSKGWTASGGHHDRFMEEPDKPTLYVVGVSGKKLFIRNQEGNYLVKYSKPDGYVYFNIIGELEFIKEFEEI